MKHLLKATVAVVLVATAFAPMSSAVAANADKKVAHYAITGMVTSNCPVLVRAAVKRIDGVLRVEASLPRKSATVTFDAKRTSAQKILAVIKDRARFKAKLVKVRAAK